MTVDEPDSWVALDLGATCLLRPTHYILQHNSFPEGMLRHWVLEASVDGASWCVLRNHINDQSVMQKGSRAVWPLSASSAYRHFRVRQTGLNSSGHFILCFGGFELYGQTNL